eukprot:294642-Prymnesium_polylepis.1
MGDLHSDALVEALAEWPASVTNLEVNNMLDGEDLGGFDDFAAALAAPGAIVPQGVTILFRDTEFLLSDYSVANGNSALQVGPGMFCATDIMFVSACLTAAGD